MALLVAIGLAIFVLEPPWEWLVVIAGALVELIETGIMIRWSKRRAAAVGAETLVDRRAVVTAECMPDGQVRVGGETWRARCRGGAAVGDEVVVRRVDGLTLVVEPA